VRANRYKELYIHLLKVCISEAKTQINTGDGCKNILVIRYAVCFMCATSLILTVSSPVQVEPHMNSCWTRHDFV